MKEKEKVVRKGPKIRKNTLGNILKLKNGISQDLSSCSFSRDKINTNTNNGGRRAIQRRGRGAPYEPSHDSIYVNYDEDSKVQRENSKILKNLIKKTILKQEKNRNYAYNNVAKSYRGTSNRARNSKSFDTDREFENW